MDCLPVQFNATPSAFNSSNRIGLDMASDLSAPATVYPKDGVIRDPPYLDVWEIEKSIDITSWAKWHDDNWHLAPICSVIYLMTGFGIKKYMRNRPPYSLRSTLFVWNAGLAIFSILGFVRCIPGMVVDLSQPSGFYTSICRTDTRNAATVFWGIMFGLSKMVELGDTLFIVLRKQPLIFLHYYHHVTVLCYVWITQGDLNSSTVWCGVMNYGIHSLMYSYYALKALQVKVPKSLAMTITTLQLLQMVGGVTVNIYILLAKYQGYSCATQTHHVYFALLMYCSYFLLFAKFFVEAYLKNRKKFQKSQ